MAEQSRRVVTRFMEEAWNNGNLDVVDELIAADYRVHATLPHLPLFGGPASSEAAPLTAAERIKQSILLRRQAFPDWRASIVHMVVEGAMVATLQHGEGHHLGEYLGTPPSGKKALMTSTSIRRIAGGQIVEEWLVIDAAGFLEQLGLWTPAAAAARDDDRDR